MSPSAVPLESQLESMIGADPPILGTPLLLVGCQEPTGFGKYFDLLAVDDEGALHILELKRDNVPPAVGEPIWRAARSVPCSTAAMADQLTDEPPRRGSRHADLHVPGT